MNKILSEEKLDEMITNSGFSPYQFESEEEWLSIREGMLHFAGLIVKECLDKIETYRIPCGNSPSGEMACEWTYDALKSIRDDIKETFGVE